MEELQAAGFSVSPVRWRWLRWRWLVFVMTICCGLVGFNLGVGVSERASVMQADGLTKLYYTLGLFIFGGMDLGTPVGGPLVGRVSLWIAYFAAPLITASAVIEAILRMVAADTLLLRRLRGHIVIAGTGQLTRLYLRRLRGRDSNRPVVVVDTNAVALEELRHLYRVQVVEGDPSSPFALRQLRLRHAARVLVMSSDDFVNLEAAKRILEIAPKRAGEVVVHLSDLRFMRSMAGTRLARACHVFNGHQIAAAHLVDVHMLVHFARTQPTDLVVLAGFGRFGQTVLNELQTQAAGAFDRVVIVDLEASRRVAVFEEEVGFMPGYTREVVDGDLQDPSLWEGVEHVIDLTRTEPVIVVGSGVDRMNLRIALRLAARYPNASVIARSDRDWSFVKQASHEAGVLTLSVAELVAQSMPDNWFGRGELAAHPVQRSREMDSPVPADGA